MNQYVIVDYHGKLAVAHTADSYSVPERVTVAWLSGVPSADHGELLGEFVGANGHDDGKTQLWPVSLRNGGTTQLRTDRLSFLVCTVPIKPPPPRKRAGRPWKWYNGRWE